MSDKAEQLIVLTLIFIAGQLAILNAERLAETGQDVAVTEQLNTMAAIAKEIAR